MTNGETLRKYRESKGLSQGELAELARVSKRTISRIEGGEITRPNATTKKRLAGALQIDVADLAKDAGEREKVERELKKAGYRKLSFHIDGETAIAYAMTQYRYGVSPMALIEMAPLFLAALAEGSLAWRRRKADELSAAVDALGSISSDAPHLAYANAGYRAEEALAEEYASIAARDVFGEKISDEAFEFGFDSAKNNPFADYLRWLCGDIDSASLEIDPHGQGCWKVENHFPEYRIAPEDYEKITGGDIWAEFAIERGHARISEIPANLMGEERKTERIAWIVSGIPEEARNEHQDWLDSLSKIEL